jgi:hypothetical protein
MLPQAQAMPLGELYGVMDPVTRDWTDGVLSKLFRELNQPLPREPFMLVTGITMLAWSCVQARSPTCAKEGVLTI